MKKFFKSSITFLFIVLFSAFTVTLSACSKKTEVLAPEVDNTIHINQLEDSNNSNDDTIINVNDSENSSSAELQLPDYNAEPEVVASYTIVTPSYGIYKFTSDLNFDNISRANKAELIEYFKTRDLNGVYGIVTKYYGFDEFVKGNFESGKDTTISNYYIKLNGNNFSNCEILTLDENNNFVIVSQNKIDFSLAISVTKNDETGELTLNIPFVYNNGTEKVITPLVICAPIEETESLEEFTSPKSFKYVNNSLVIDVKNNTEESLNLLAEAFNIAPDADIKTEVASYLKNCRFKFNSSKTTLCINHIQDFEFAHLSDNEYASHFGSISIVSDTLNLQSNVHKIILKVTTKTGVTFILSIVEQ